VKIVFLDFDGVLNSHAHLRTLPAEERAGVMGLDPTAVARLNRFVEADQDIDFVVSSTWRYDHDVPALQTMLSEKGLRGCVRGRTPRMLTQHGVLVSAPCRGQEILAWLELAPDYGYAIESFVILDDDADMAPISDRLVQTTFAEGLLDSHVEKALEVLQIPMPMVAIPPEADAEYLKSRLRFVL